MLECKNLSFSYHKNQNSLSNVSFRAKQGSVLGILGHNGSGKSTLLRLIARLKQPQKGEILLNERSLNSWGHEELNKFMGVLIESPSFYNHLSLKDNIGIIERYRSGTDWSVLRALLNRLELDDHVLDKKMRQFSTGMRQRAAIALTLYFEPSIILLDEPTTGLDPDGIRLIRELIFEFRDKGSTVLVTGHHLSEIEKMCDHFLILRSGALIFDGPMEAARAYRDLEDMYIAITHNS